MTQEAKAMLLSHTRGTFEICSSTALPVRWTTDPIRRTYIPKSSNPNELRGLGIPTLRDRAMQAVVKLALEPEWEAQFEPNSYGFRPGRSIHDAIEAIFNHIRLKPKLVLDADILDGQRQYR